MRKLITELEASKHCLDKAGLICLKGICVANLNMPMCCSEFVLANEGTREGEVIERGRLKQSGRRVLRERERQNRGWRRSVGEKEREIEGDRGRERRRGRVCV